MSMHAQELLLCCVLVAGCLIGAWYDFRSRIIPNWLVLAMLVIGMVLRLTLYLQGTATLFALLVVPVLGLAVAFGLFAAEVWAPGDAKLYWAICVCFPLTLGGGSMNIPVQALLAALAVTFLVLIARQLHRIPKVMLDMLGQMGNLSLGGAVAGLAQFFVRLTACLGFGYMLAPLLAPLGLSTLRAMIIMPVAFAFMATRVPQKYQNFIYAPFAMLALWFAYQAPMAFVRILFITVPIFWFVRTFAIRLAEGFVEEVLVGDLEEGMIPLDKFIALPDGQCQIMPKEKPAPKGSRLAFDKGTFSLTHEDMDSIARLVEHGRLEADNKVRVQHTIRLGPAIAVGTLLILGLNIWWQWL